MKLITREILASKALKKFSQQYPDLTGNKKDIFNRVKLLGSNPNPDDVDKAIGNKSWTKVPSCTECKKDYSNIVEFESDFYFLYLCENCLNKAIKSI